MDLSTLNVIHSGKIMLNSKRNAFVLTQTDPTYVKLEPLCSSIIEQKWRHQATGNKSRKQLELLTFETRCLRPYCQKKILFWSKTSKCIACSGVNLQNLRPVLDFWKWKMDPGQWPIPVWPTLQSPPPGLPIFAYQQGGQFQSPWLFTSKD